MDIIIIKHIIMYSRLADLEAGQKDSSAYLKWQEEVKQQAIAQRLSEQKKHHLVSSCK